MAIQMEWLSCKYFWLSYFENVWSLFVCLIWSWFLETFIRKRIVINYQNQVDENSNLSWPEHSPPHISCYLCQPGCWSLLLGHRLLPAPFLPSFPCQSCPLSSYLAHPWCKSVAESCHTSRAYPSPDVGLLLWLVGLLHIFPSPPGSGLTLNPCCRHHINQLVDRLTGFPKPTKGNSNDGWLGQPLCHSTSDMLLLLPLLTPAGWPKPSFQLPFLLPQDCTTWWSHSLSSPRGSFSLSLQPHQEALLSGLVWLFE